MSTRHQHDAVLWHMNELTSRVVAASGCATDRFHLGKIILTALRDHPEHILQIDGASGSWSSSGWVARRSVQCALALRRRGVRHGAVAALLAPNHLQLAVPLYAGLCEGVALAPVDRTLGADELRGCFAAARPQLVLCQRDRAADVRAALDAAALSAQVLCFDGAGPDSFTDWLAPHDDEQLIANYKPADFDPADTLAFLIPTSGTTGLPKAAAATHKSFALMAHNAWGRSTEIPFYRRCLVVSPLQWLSAILHFIVSPYLQFTRIQSSLPITQTHAYHLINTYKPDFIVLSPTMMSSFLKSEDRDQCDFTCFKLIYLGGSNPSLDIISELKALTPETEVLSIYGMSEITSLGFIHTLSSPAHSCGKPVPSLQHKLVDLDTGLDINEPDKKGELWVKGPGLFKEYYNNPEATKEAFSADGWLKTGDLMYRDAAWNYYFVDRIKLLLKYKNHQISPTELEAVIRGVAGVRDVAVTGVPHAQCGELPVACVVPRAGCTLTARDIHHAVRARLADSKQLRGGVVFMDQLPTTATSKIHRTKLKEMVLTMNSELID